MGASVRESDYGKPSKSESPKNASANGTPPSHATEVADAPWKRSRRREVFEGDVTLVELPSRFGPERIPEPVPLSTAPTFSGLPRAIGAVAMTAAAAGVAGYIWGFKLSTKIPELSLVPLQANALPAPSTRATTLTASNRDFDPSAAARTAPIGLAPADTRRVANPVTSVDATQRIAPLPTPPQTVSPSVTAAKMKVGVELMTYGEVTAARMMFQRVAEAGEGAGAFALAETYDPLVLGELRLREEVKPDLALARAWYERARDLGLLEARDRISRLARLPQ
jgi:hypothetical protein